MNNARVQLLFQPICCVRCKQSTHTVFLYAAGALSVIKAAASAAGRKGSQWARTQHARNQLHHKFIRSQILHKQTEVLFSFAKFMIHPGAHHNKQLTHAARPRYKVSRWLCSDLCSHTRSRAAVWLIWCTPDILSAQNQPYLYTLTAECFWHRRQGDYQLRNFPIINGIFCWYYEQMGILIWFFSARKRNKIYSLDK
jgi:hypothetical protein